MEMNIKGENKMEKRQKSLLRITGILLMIYCIYSLITAIPSISIILAGLVPAKLYNSFIINSVVTILELISIGFIAVVLLKGHYNKLLGITFGIYALLQLVRFISSNLAAYYFISFLLSALLCVVILFEKPIAKFKKPITLLCAYLSIALVLVSIINMWSSASEITRSHRWGEFYLDEYLGFLLSFIFSLIFSLSFISVSSLIANNSLNEKSAKLNKLGSLGFICLPIGIVLGFLIALISSLIYGYVYFFNGFFVTKILWVIVLLLTGGGAVLLPLTILYPAKSRITSVNNANNGIVDNEGYISLGKHIVLCIFTFGIWYLIWIYRTTAFLNKTPNAEQHNPTSKLLLCIFIPFYSIFWFYKQGQRIDMMSKSKNLNYSDMATMCLVLGIFIPIVACILMQDRINNICQAKENVKDNTEKDLENLQQLKNLLDSGVITKEEFDAKKKQLLGL